MSQPTTPTKHSKLGSFLLGAPKFHLGVIVVLALGLTVSVVSRFLTVGNLEGRLIAQKRSLLTKANENLHTQTADLLRLSAAPLGWAIRSAMLTNAMGDVDAYLVKLVENKYVKRVALVDLNDNIVAATNAKIKNQLASTVFLNTKMDVSELQLMPVEGTTRVIVPIMDFTKRIGTLIYEYSDESISRFSVSEAN